MVFKGIYVDEVSKLSPLCSTHFDDNGTLNLRDMMTIFVPWFKECRDIAKYHVKDPYPQYYRAVEQNMILLLSDKGSLRLILTLIIDSRQMQ